MRSTFCQLFQTALYKQRYRARGLTLWPALVVSLALFADAYAQTAPRSWPFQATIGAFRVHSDFPIEGQELLSDTLEHLRSDMTEMLSLPLNKSVIHIVLFGSSSEYVRYMQHYFPSIVKRRAIYLQDRGPGMLFTSWHDDIETDLRHEVSHALLNQTGSQLPLWLDEGLAEYFEVARDSRYSNSPYVFEVTERAKQGIVPSIVELEKIEQIADYTDDHYRDSWAWVHLLLHRRQQTRQLLSDYLARARNRAPQPPISRLLPQVLEDLNQEFQSHFARLQVEQDHGEP